MAKPPKPIRHLTQSLASALVVALFLGCPAAAQKPGAKQAAAKPTATKDAAATPSAAQDAAAKPTGAKPEHEAIRIGHKRSIESKVLGETRELWVHTPRGYDKSKRSYPVLYLLDGPHHFTHTVGTSGFLARNGKMPEVIVVGIKNTERTRDMTPTKDASIKMPAMANAGGGDRFLAFLSDEVAPFLAKEYRTSGYRMLVGTRSVA